MGGGRPGNDSPADGIMSVGLYRSIVEHSGDIVTLVDKHGIVRYQNPAIGRILKLDPSLSIGLHAADLTHPDDQARVRDHLEKCFATPGWRSMEHFRIMDADGNYHWFEARAQNLIDDPEVGYLLVLSRDVTDLRRLEQRIDQAEQTGRFGYWRIGWNGEAPVWSHGLISLLGYDPEDPTEKGTDWQADLIHPHDRERVVGILSGAFENQEPFSYRARVRAADGSYRHITSHGYAELNAHGQAVALAGLIEDITDRVEAEEALKRSEAQYRLLAEEASDIVATHNVDGVLTFISPASRRILGYRPEDLIGKRLDDIVESDDLGAVGEEVARIVRGEDSVTLSYRIRHRNGQAVWMETALRAIRDEATGRVREFVSNSRDITDRKRHEREVNQARERAEAANRTKSQFLANMSHELRTPLNAILGFSDMMDQELFGPVKNDRYKEYVELIHHSGKLLLDLINDVLDMAKIEAGRFKLDRQEICLADLAGECAKLMEKLAMEQELRLRLVMHADRGSLFASVDRRAVTQILLNLLSNAIKFTKEGGEVTLSTFARKDRVGLQVSDTGIGINPAELPRLLRPFEQVAQDSSLAAEGAGLGLALVKSLCELHGGEMEIESEPDQGTTVTVLLPRTIPTDTKDRFPAVS